MLSDQYRGHAIRTDYKDMWIARIFEPGAARPHPVVVRATEKEGEAIVVRRAKILIDELVTRKDEQDRRGRK